MPCPRVLSTGSHAMLNDQFTTAVPVDCGVPVLEQDVVIDPPSSSSTTTESSTITFHCAKGLTPNHTVSSVCTSEGKWEPDPTQHTCSNTSESLDATFMPNTGMTDILQGVLTTAQCGTFNL